MITTAAQTGPTVTLTPDQVRTFKEKGYLVLPAISTPEEVAELREIFDELFTQKAGFAEGAQYDMLGADEKGGPPQLSQIINPINYAPALRNTVFRANALSLARQLLGPAAAPAFEHAILKPAHYGGATPWHQDEAHRFDANFDYRQLSIWMPLQEATLENGCMKYIPGSNLGEVLEHQAPNNDPNVHALETKPGTFDESLAVPCPIPPGGCTAHHGRTIHCAGPNSSDAPRRAYILAFEIPPSLRSEPRDFPWNRRRHTASEERRRQWRRRGGLLVESWRKLRGGFLTNPRRLAFEVKRVIRAIRRR